MWKPRDKFYEQNNDMYSEKAFDIGLCRIHIEHGTLQITNRVVWWFSCDTQTVMYLLIKESSARRPDYIHMNDSNKLSLNVCS